MLTESVASPHPGEPNKEALWRAWTAPATWPAVALEQWAAVLVLAAHPLDPILGVGGTLHRLRQRGATVTVIIASDGERSHPRSKVLSAASLSEAHHMELNEAMRRLGGGFSTVWLRLPDSDLASRAEDLDRALGPVMASVDTCLAPAPHDSDTDHRAVAASAARLAARSHIRLFGYPLRLWRCSHPDDPSVDWSAANRVDLSPDVRRAKGIAIEAFTSETVPLGTGPDEAATLPVSEQAHFRRDYETLFGVLTDS